MPQLKHIMNTDVPVCAPKTSIKDAAALMSQKRATALPVIEEGRLVGVLYDTDLLKMEQPLRIPSVLGILGAVVYLDNPLNGDEVEKQIMTLMSTEVESVMAREFAFFDPETKIEEAAARMVEGNFHFAPIVADGQLVGSVSSLDLIALLSK